VQDYTFRQNKMAVCDKGRHVITETDMRSPQI